MSKVVSFAAFAFVSTLIAAPAWAAELPVAAPSTPVVRIPLAGKTPDQVRTEIKAAAVMVCSQLQDASNVSCVADTVADANSQFLSFGGLTRTASKLEVARSGPTTIHLALNGKTPAQIDAAIRGAAEAVCTAAQVSASEYEVCVGGAVDDAKTQLGSLAQNDRPQRLASN